MPRRPLWPLALGALIVIYLYLRHGFWPRARPDWAELYSPTYTGCQLAYPIHHDRLQATTMYASLHPPSNISEATRTLAKLEQILGDEGVGQSIALPYWADSKMITKSLQRTENLNPRVIEHHARMREYWLCKYAERLGIAVVEHEGSTGRRPRSSCTGVTPDCTNARPPSSITCKVDNTASCYIPTHPDAHAVFHSGLGNTYGVYKTEAWQVLVAREGEDRVGLYNWRDMFEACCA